jgi:hypothetical protein
MAVMETALMKLPAAISTTTLFLLLGTTLAANAPQDRQEQPDKSEKQEEKAKPERKEPQVKPPKQEQANKTVKRDAKQAKQEQKDEPANHEAKPAKQEQNAEHTKQQDQQSVQHSQGDNGKRDGGSHGRISDAHYRASFGSGHNFRVNQGDYEHRRFNYGGYSFGFVDAWPDSWYYTDNVYVVYEGGGYYMYDAIHPGMRISVNIL